MSIKFIDTNYLNFPTDFLNMDRGHTPSKSDPDNVGIYQMLRV